jgi:hypothetical protein
MKVTPTFSRNLVYFLITVIGILVVARVVTLLAAGE